MLTGWTCTATGRDRCRPAVLAWLTRIAARCTRRARPCFAVSLRAPIEDRWCNQALPQLTDGQGLPHVAGNESEPLPLPSARYPVVRMLLPSAALSGVVSGADARGSEDLSGDLMQVSCQVLNASRWGGA